MPNEGSSWVDWFKRYLGFEREPGPGEIPPTPSAWRNWLQKNLNQQELERLAEHLKEKNLADNIKPEVWLTVAREALEELRYSDPEMFQAYDRLFGSSNPSTDIMNWFLRFADLNLDALSRGDWLNLKYEIMALIRQPYWALSFDPDRHPKRLKSFEDVGPEMRSRTGWGPFGDPMVLPTKTEVTELQDLICRHLNELASQVTVRFDPITVKISLVWDVFEVPNRLEPLYYIDTPSAAFAYRLAYVLSLEGGKIRRCPECQRRFLADRRNQVFCSGRCQNRVAARRFRNTPPEREGKRGRPRKEVAQEPRGKEKPKQVSDKAPRKQKKAPKRNQNLTGGLSHGQKRRA